jgi:hypothetical protein
MLITSSGTRALVHRAAESTAGMPNNVIDYLERNYLVRAEWRAGAKWYELTHDRMIMTIKSSNNVWRKKVSPLKKWITEIKTKYKWSKT